MNWKIFLLRFGGLIALSILGGILFAIVVNLLVAVGLTPQDDFAASEYGDKVTMDAALLYMVSIIVGFVGIFIKDVHLRWVLYTAPLYAAASYAIIYTLFHA